MTQLPPKKLLDQLRDQIRLKQYFLRAEKNVRFVGAAVHSFS